MIEFILTLVLACVGSSVLGIANALSEWAILISYVGPYVLPPLLVLAFILWLIPDATMQRWRDRKNAGEEARINDARVRRNGHTGDVRSDLQRLVEGDGN